ncbi:MAG TPA: acyl-CoA dehydrogenase [Candidatus Scatomorpha intestinigallinarum]|jgi:butyryl-CoA dehydrogenase|uniref:Acyl-CoA dehydrogenase n=2 Tax=Candidatus Scatomorpha intestinigallinarum TaxID=2840923 RepID=A0A9D1DL75_9FIRM|nr:acyl-CoA dehydrogenase [Candidatus Scatomorpha intestinigallinarum]
MFNLSEEHIQLQQTFREFAENEVKPLAKELDETERFPTETVQKMAEMGMMGLPIPEELGGSGVDQLGYVLAVEELSKVCATTGIILSAHTSLCCWPIMTFGTEEQKEKYLKPLASGQKLGAFALTEPSAGTDASMQKSTAVLDGDHYILNGNKVFITNAGAADVFIVFAMTDKEQGTRGITAFILERDMPGFTMGKPENKMGLRASSTCELVFDNVRVPVENRLGAEGKGFKIAMATLDGGRIGVGAQAVGIAQGAIDEAVKFTKERIQFGRRISQFQNTQFTLADMQTRTDAARMLVWRAAAAEQEGQPYTHLAAMAKLFASETASYVTNRAVQLCGGYGYTKDYPVERMMRDAKVTEIYEGTSEVQRMVISGWMGVK